MINNKTHDWKKHLTRIEVRHESIISLVTETDSNDSEAIN